MTTDAPSPALQGKTTENVGKGREGQANVSEITQLDGHRTPDAGAGAGHESYAALQLLPRR